MRIKGIFDFIVKEYKERVRKFQIEFIIIALQYFENSENEDMRKEFKSFMLNEMSDIAQYRDIFKCVLKRETMHAQEIKNELHISEIRQLEMNNIHGVNKLLMYIYIYII